MSKAGIAISCHLLERALSLLFLAAGWQEEHVLKPQSEFFVVLQEISAKRKANGSFFTREWCFGFFHEHLAEIVGAIGSAGVLLKGSKLIRDRKVKLLHLDEK